MTPHSKPIDALLFEVIHTHSMRTRGQPAKRVTLEYLDGSETTLPLPDRAEIFPTDPAPLSWPPPEGWAFRPGEAAFNGTKFRLSGKLIAILRELAGHPGEPVKADTLKLNVWGEEPDLVEDGNLQGHVSILRKKLRDALGLGDDFNPVLHADGAYRLAVY